VCLAVVDGAMSATKVRKEEKKGKDNRNAIRLIGTIGKTTPGKTAMTVLLRKKMKGGELHRICPFWTDQEKGGAGGKDTSMGEKKIAPYHDRVQKNKPLERTGTAT